MQKLMIFLIVGLMAACSSSTGENDESEKEVTPETTEKIKKVQDENIELEEIDGELDSLLTTLE